MDKTIVFVCEHGAAKSILAATYFDHFAIETGLNLRASARGTNPDPEVSQQTIKGLMEDGLMPIHVTPQKLTKSDIQSARRVIAFCELPGEFRRSSAEYWKDVPPVSENYGRARDAIIERIRHLMKSFG